jgi:hypothetical protein
MNFRISKVEANSILSKLTTTALPILKTLKLTHITPSLQSSLLSFFSSGFPVHLNIFFLSTINLFRLDAAVTTQLSTVLEKVKEEVTVKGIKLGEEVIELLKGAGRAKKVILNQ